MTDRVQSQELTPSAMRYGRVPGHNARLQPRFPSVTEQSRRKQTTRYGTLSWLDRVRTPHDGRDRSGSDRVRARMAIALPTRRMTSNANSEPELPAAIAADTQVDLRRDGERVAVLLPAVATTGNDWSEVRQQTIQRLNASESFWSAGTGVVLRAGDRLLDGRQLQELAALLHQAHLRLERVETSRRQTAVAAATAGYSVEQGSLAPSFVAPKTAAERAEPLYLQATVRSGMEVRHPGSIVIWGDLNPGATAIAAGDILVWGRLRGFAHAGSTGNRQSTIAALHLEPTQLRIADAVARSPESTPDAPEVAFIAMPGIRIARALDFRRTHTYSPPQGCWLDG